MSLYSVNTSILKPARSRDALRDNINRVRFELLANRSLNKVLLGIEANDVNSVRDYNDYLRMIRDECISEADFVSAIQESRECIALLTKYKDLAQALLSLDWLRQPVDAVVQYQLFLVDLLSAHNKYTKFAVRQLAGQLVPRPVDEFMWIGGRPQPDSELADRVRHVLDTIGRVLEVIPLSRAMVLQELDAAFPFHTKPSYAFAGYVNCLMRLMNAQPDLKADLFRMVFGRLIVLDCYTPREEIELAEYVSDADDDDEESGSDDTDSEDMFEMELDGTRSAGEQQPDKAKADEPMKSVQAESLDLCMEQLFAYLDEEHKREMRLASHRTTAASSATFQLLIDTFQNVLLPAHNTHHVQFVLFYFSSFNAAYAEHFAQICWQRLRDVNAAAPIRQAAVGYLASALSRSTFLGVAIVQEYLHEMCTWIRMYIKRCDSGQNVYSLKAHGPFYATCQAMFYVISFRSRELTHGPRNLMFLQSLQLNAIVTSALNPLRLCQTAVATAFSGVTRAHQLAYCHTILERNARKRLATITGNDLLAPVESLETFFPFDQYMLRKSGRRITPIYRQYQASEAEESASPQQQRLEDAARLRKRHNLDEDDVDFISVDKRCKIVELSKSFDRELQFNHFSTTPKS